MRARIYAHFSSMPLAQSAASSVKHYGCNLYALQIVSNPCPNSTHRPFAGGSLFPVCSPSANASWPLAVPGGSSAACPLFLDPASQLGYPAPAECPPPVILPAAVSARRPKDGVTLMIQTDGHWASPAAQLLKSCGGQGISIF